jgi:hypothetical protein
MTATWDCGQLWGAANATWDGTVLRIGLSVPMVGLFRRNGFF